MKKTAIFIFMFVLVSGLWAQNAEVSSWDGTASKWTNGSGTIDEPYLIDKAEHLAQLAVDIKAGVKYDGKHFKLTTDLDMNGAPADSPRRQWIPIGKTIEKPFSGHFDGGNHVIRDLYVNETTDYTGLFGVILKGSVINLGIDGDSNITGVMAVGAIAGQLIGQYAVGVLPTVINDCYSNATVTGDTFVGGITGMVSLNCDIRRSYNKGTVNGKTYVGGIVGSIKDSKVTDCYNAGSLSSTDAYIGGLVGSARGLAYVMGCYNIGDVAGGKGHVGGIIGVFYAGQEGTCAFSSCYNVGKVTGKSSANDIGALGGMIFNFITKKSYFLLDSGPINNNGIPKSDADMKIVEFVDLLNEGWINDLYVADITPNINNGYPVLTWQVKYNVIVEVTGGVGGTVTGGGAYAPDTEIELMAKADAGYKFVKWNDGVVDNPRRVKVESNVTYAAEFKATVEAVSLWDGTASQWTKGSGTRYDPFLIESAAHLAQLAKNINEDGILYDNNYFKLMLNIDLNGAVGNETRLKWIPIGWSNSQKNPKYFKGHFDGNGRVIRNMYVDQTANYAGFFGIVHTLSSVSNLGIDAGCSVTGAMYVGGIVGWSESPIINCYNLGTIVGTSDVGGVVGTGKKPIANCYNKGTVTGTSNTGGVVGDMSNPLINCYNTGMVVGTGTNTGALAGKCTFLKNSYFLSGSGIDNKKGVAKTEEEMKSADFIISLNRGLIQWQRGEEYPVLIWQTVEVNSWGAVASEGFSRGEGTKDDPYTIRRAEELARLAKMVNEGDNCSGKYFKLTSDIDLRGVKDNEEIMIWIPIGKVKGVEFKGNFDGCGYEIKNMYVYEIVDNAGLFGIILDGNVSNVGIVGNSNVGGMINHVGGVVGNAISSNISNCYNHGNSSSYTNAGGIVGVTSSLYVGDMAVLTNVLSCYNTGSVSADQGCGGIVGNMTYSNVTNCYNTGSVNGLSMNSGGISGIASLSTISTCYNKGAVCNLRGVGGISGKPGNGSILNSYNVGAVSGGSYVGGVAGEAAAATNIVAKFTNCYNVGTVTCEGANTGGFVGAVSNITLTNCYYLEGSGKNNAKGEAKSMEEMKNEEFIATLNTDNIPIVWKFDITPNLNAGYPIFTWQTLFEIKVRIANNIGGTVTGAGKYEYGVEATLTPLPAEHYAFSKWNDDNTDNPRKIIVTGNATYTSEFKQKEYTITANADEGGSTQGSGKYVYGTSVALKAIPNAGYGFVKWNDDNIENPRVIKVTGDATYSAVFGVNKYVVTVNAGTGGSATGGGNYAHGATATLTATPDTEYTFMKWNDGNTDNPRNVTVTANAIYRAEFKIKSYTVNVVAGKNGTVSGGGKYDHGDIATLVATPDKDYVFKAWNDGNTENPRNVIVTTDGTYTAEFKKPDGVESIEEILLKIYPNPMQDIINICGEYTSIEIYNASGKVVATANGESRVDVSHLVSGVYIVKAYSNGKVGTYKIVK